MLFISVVDEGSDDSLKWSSPNISVQVEEEDSKDFTGLILFHERDSSSVGFSGNMLSKMCCRLSQVAMALLASELVFC